MDVIKARWGCERVLVSCNSYLRIETWDTAKEKRGDAPYRREDERMEAMSSL